MPKRRRFLNCLATLIVVLLLPVLASFESYAQELPGGFERFTRESGLPQNYISGIVRDEQGFLWLGTREGLVLFDGTTFRIVDIGDDLEGVDISQIWPRLLDKANRLWSFTNNATLGYDISTGEVHVYNFASFNSVFQDSSGQVYFVSENELLRVESDSWEISTVATFQNETSILGIDSLDKIWLSQSMENGALSLIRYDPTLLISTSIPIEPEVQEITAFFFDSDQVVWMGSNSGFYSFDMTKSTWVDYSKKVDGQRITGIDEAVNGELWVLSWSRLYKFNPVLDQIEFEELDLANTPIFASELYVDKLKVVWIGSRTGGLIRKKPAVNMFTHYGEQSLQGVELPSNLVMSLETKDGDLFIGALRGGLSRLNLKTNKLQELNLSGPRPDASCNQSVWDSIVTASNGVWLGTSDGLCVTDDDGKTFRVVKPPVQLTPRAVVSTMELSRNGKYFWIGLYDGQILVFDLQREEFSSLQLPPSQEDIVSGPIWALKEDVDGNLWIGNSNSGLNRYSPSTGSIDVINGDEDFRSIYEDRQGRFWVAGLSGLSLLTTDPEPRLRKVKASSASPGQIFSIADDKLGRLWLGTVNGIWLFTANNFLIDDEDLSGWFTPFTLDQGMPAMEFNRRAIARIDDQLFFGGSGGFISFKPESISGPTDFKQVHLTSSQIIGKEGVKESHIYSKDYIDIGPDEYAFTFEFSSPDMNSDVKRNNWVYLEGFDLDWIDIDERQSITYTNVPPGDYKLFIADGQISPSNSDQLEPVTTIRIQAPWWRTKLFLFIAATLLSIFGFLIYQARVRILKKRAEELREEVKIRTRELSLEKKKTDEQSERLKDLDAAKNRFFSNLSHEFRTPLTLIISPIQYALEGGYANAPEKLEEQHKLVLRSANKLLVLINQLLDLAKIDSRKMELHRMRRNLVPIVRDIVKGFSSVAEYRGVLLRYEMPRKSVYSIIDEEKIRAVIENLLTNALKYTPRDGIVVVRVDQVGEENEKSAQIIVSDSGPGIPEQDLPHLFERFYQAKDVSGSADPGTGIGLSFANELVRLHNGKIEVQSEIGSGARFIVSLPSTPEPDYKDDESDTMVDGFGAIKMLIGDEHENLWPKVEKEANGPSILIAEDNYDMRQLVVSRLSEDFKVQEADNGLDTLAMVQNERPELILMDVLMPGMSGIEVCKKIKSISELADIPIILFSAKATEQARMEGFDAGADDYVEKPFSVTELSVRITNLIESRRKLRSRYASSSRSSPSTESPDSSEED